MQDPIYSAGQYPPNKSRDNAPIPFLTNGPGPLGNIHSDLYWRLNDFCRIHQIVYKDIRHVEKHLEEIESNKVSTEELDDEEMEEARRVSYSRRLDYIMDMDEENKRIHAFVDHMTIIGLWAISEQFLGKVYRGILSIQNGSNVDSISTPYQWDRIKTAYLEIGIDLAERENYSNANECRVLNNSIKHSSKVGQQLIQFEYFRSMEADNLDTVPLEMQRYLNGVSDFLGSTIEKGNEILGYTFP